MKHLLALLGAWSLSFAAQTLVDGISLLVNNHPITLLSVYQMAKEMGVKPQEAIEPLVQKSLEETEAKRFNLEVSHSELQQEMEAVAASRGLPLAQFEQLIKERYGSIEPYRDELRAKLLRDKLHQKIATTKAESIDEQALRRYFVEHPDEFGIPGRIHTTKLFSGDRAALERQLSRPMEENPLIQRTEETLQTATLSTRFAQMVVTVPVGSFTPIIDVGGTYVSFYIRAREEIEQIPFEQAKDLIYGKLVRSQQEKAVREHFEKLRAGAKITVLRLP